MHVPDKRVTTLPKVVEEALDFADAFYGELALEPELQMQVMPKMMMGGGQTLKKVLPPELHKRITDYLNSKGLGQVAPMLEGMKPWAVGSQLGQLDYLMELQMGAQPLDQMLYNRCKQAGKEVGGLEQVEEQLGVFESLTMEEQIKSLSKSLDEMEKAAKEGKKATDDLLEKYLKGEMGEIEEKAKEEFDPENETDKKMMKLLVIDRNVRMADRIHEKLEKNKGKSYFFAVGTLHYPGEQGILRLLEAKGHKITRLLAKDAGSLPKKEKKSEGESKPPTGDY
jgi:uncharacterized protein YbaP (TraB family)